MKIGPSERALRMLDDLADGTTSREVFAAGYHAGAAETFIKVVDMLSEKHPAAALMVGLVATRHAVGMATKPAETIDTDEVLGES